MFNPTLGSRYDPAVPNPWALLETSGSCDCDFEASKASSGFQRPMQNQDSVSALRGELQITYAPLYFYPNVRN